MSSSTSNKKRYPMPGKKYLVRKVQIELMDKFNGLIPKAYAGNEMKIQSGMLRERNIGERECEKVNEFFDTVTSEEVQDYVEEHDLKFKAKSAPKQEVKPGVKKSGKRKLEETDSDESSGDEDVDHIAEPKKPGETKRKQEEEKKAIDDSDDKETKRKQEDGKKTIVKDLSPPVAAISAAPVQEKKTEEKSRAGTYIRATKKVKIPGTDEYQKPRLNQFYEFNSIWFSGNEAGCPQENYFRYSDTLDVKHTCFIKREKKRRERKPFRYLELISQPVDISGRLRQDARIVQSVL